MKTYFINLDRTPDRLQQFITRNAHLRDLVRFPAIDGDRLALRALLRNGMIEDNIRDTYSRGGLGTALSHLSLWNLSIRDDTPMTICEDDALFHHGFADIMQSVIARLPADWDWISWGWNFDAILMMDFLPGTSPCIVACDQEAMRRGAEHFQRQPISPQPVRLLGTMGLPCYSISPKGARAFRAKCWPLRDLSLYLPGMNATLSNIGIDVAIAAAFPQTQAYVCYPPLVISPNETDNSTVQQGKTARETMRPEPSDAPAPAPAATEAGA